MIDKKLTQEVLDLIKEYDRVIIFRHKRPDGDAVGSTMGLARILTLSYPEKEIKLINSDSSDYLSFVEKEDGDMPDELKSSYPVTPYEKKGILWELFEKNPNLYGDISAGSAHRALSKDPKGYEFLQKYHKQVCFGTDRFTDITEPIPPIIGYLKEGLETGKLTQEAYDNITHKNYLRITAG